jgi:hypothetical protein
MEKDAFRNRILVKGRVKLFHELNPSYFQNPGKLSERTPPVGNVMQHPKAEYGIH